MYPSRSEQLQKYDCHLQVPLITTLDSNNQRILPDFLPMPQYPQPTVLPGRCSRKMIQRRRNWQDDNR